MNCGSGRGKRKRFVQGGSQIRRVLYMAALSARRHNPATRTFAKRLEASGKPFKVVITACMHKLLVILNSPYAQSPKQANV